MASRRSEEPSWWRSLYLRHRRALLVAYGVAVLFVLVGFAVGPVRRGIFTGMEAAVEAWEGRWSPRVVHGEELVASGRYEEAIRYLVRLDREFPARDVRHARDRERERILRALGRAYVATDQEREALDAFGRAVEFDPLNYRNRLALARAAQRFGEPEIALEQFRAILEMRPSHLPSLVEVVAHGYDEGDYSGVVQVFESYLDAFVVHHVVVRAGAWTDTVPVIVDGRFRQATSRLDGPGDRPSALSLEVGPYAAEVRSARLSPRLTVGRAGGGSLTPPGEGPWRLGSALLPSQRAIEEFPVGETIGSRSPGQVLEIPLPDTPARPGTVTLDLRLQKPMDMSTWELVRASYRNILDFEGLARARRTAFLRGPDTDGGRSPSGLAGRARPSASPAP